MLSLRGIPTLLNMKNMVLNVLSALEVGLYLLLGNHPTNVKCNLFHMYVFAAIQHTACASESNILGARAAV